MNDRIAKQNKGISAFVATGFSLFYFSFGTLDLENRMTAVHSLVKKSRKILPESDPNIETFFGLPIYDYALGFGTNLPIASGLSRISPVTFFIELPDDIFTITFLGLILSVSLYCLLQSISNIRSTAVITRLLLSIISLYPLIVYTLINDWPDVAISYLSLLIINSTLFQMRQIPSEMRLPANTFPMLLLGLVISFFGQTGYLPIIFIVTLAQVALFRDKYFTCLRYQFLQYKWLTFTVIVLLSFAIFNLIGILKTEISNLNQIRVSQELFLSFNPFNSRQPSLGVVLFLAILIFRLRDRPDYKCNKELILVAGIFLYSWYSSGLGILAPSSEWLIRDFLWIQVLMFLAVSKVFFKRNQLKSKITNSVGAILILLTFISPFLSLSGSPISLREVSWINPNDKSDSIFQQLLQKRFLLEGDRVLTAPSELIRNRGGGISGLISYNDLTSQGITSFSSWSKMRDSSALVYDTKLFENRAFMEDCNSFIIQLSSPSVVIIDKLLLNCNQDVQNLGYLKTWSNEKYTIYRGITESIYEFQDNRFSPGFLEKIKHRFCGLFQQDCQVIYEEEFASSWKYDKAGPFCQPFTKVKGWCLEFDRENYERFVITPILFEDTLYNQANLNIMNMEGLTALKIPANFEGEILLRYKPSFLDLGYYYSSLGLSIAFLYLSIRIIFTGKADSYLYRTK